VHILRLSYIIIRLSKSPKWKCLPKALIERRTHRSRRSFLRAELKSDWAKHQIIFSECQPAPKFAIFALRLSHHASPTPLKLTAGRKGLRCSLVLISRDANSCFVRAAPIHSLPRDFINVPASVRCENELVQRCQRTHQGHTHRTLTKALAAQINQKLIYAYAHLNYSILGCAWQVAGWNARSANTCFWLIILWWLRFIYINIDTGGKMMYSGMFVLISEKGCHSQNKTQFWTISSFLRFCNTL